METTNENIEITARPPFFKTALEKAAVVTGVLIAFTMILYLLELHHNRWVASTSFILMLVLVFSFGRSYALSARKEVFTYGQAFRFLMAIFFLSALMSAVFNYIYFLYIAPETIDMAIEEAYENLMKSGMSEEKAMEIMGMQMMWMNPLSFAATAAISTVLFGMLLSLIMAVFIKQEPKSL
ncbi:MAG: DUF4199 domain-containing protein [Cryomorphaceae bacterium]|nr:MAG: DUF4199 domain-containing protein [Cryomorphaceae bacterium]